MKTNEKETRTQRTARERKQKAEVAQADGRAKRTDNGSIHSEHQADKPIDCGTGHLTPGDEGHAPKRSTPWSNWLATDQLDGGDPSEKARPYDLVPSEGQRRVADRFQLGAEKHGPNGWKQCLKSRGDAAAFAHESYNHMHEHMLRMKDGVALDDDHLGAIGWAVMVLAHIEDVYGMPWTSL